MMRGWLLWLCSVGLWATTAQSEPYQRLLDRYGRTLVTVNYVLSADFAGTLQRAQGEVEGMVIGADGLVLIPSSVLNPNEQFRGLATDEGMGPMPDIQSGEFRVRIPGFDQPLRAKVASQDQDLGVAWLKIETPPPDLPYVDLAQATEPRVGAPVFSLNLASEGFDYAPFVIEGRVQGRITVPYRAYVTNQGNKLLFDQRARPVGFAIFRFAGSAGAGSGGVRVFGVMIPAPRLAELTAQVRRDLSRP